MSLPCRVVRNVAEVCADPGRLNTGQEQFVAPYLVRDDAENFALPDVVKYDAKVCEDPNLRDFGAEEFAVPDLVGAEWGLDSGLAIVAAEELAAPDMAEAVAEWGSPGRKDVAAEIPALPDLVKESAEEFTDPGPRRVTLRISRASLGSELRGAASPSGKACKPRRAARHTDSTCGQRGEPRAQLGGD